LLHFNLADFLVKCSAIICADKLMVMGSSKNLHVFTVILRFYSNHENPENLMLMKCTCRCYDVAMLLMCSEH